MMRRKSGFSPFQEEWETDADAMLKLRRIRLTNLDSDLKFIQYIIEKTVSANGVPQNLKRILQCVKTTILKATSALDFEEAQPWNSVITSSVGSTLHQRFGLEPSTTKLMSSCSNAVMSRHEEAEVELAGLVLVELKNLIDRRDQSFEISKVYPLVAWFKKAWRRLQQEKKSEMKQHPPKFKPSSPVQSASNMEALAAGDQSGPRLESNDDDDFDWTDDEEDFFDNGSESHESSKLGLVLDPSESLEAAMGSESSSLFAAVGKDPRRRLSVPEGLPPPAPAAAAATAAAPPGGGGRRSRPGSPPFPAAGSPPFSRPGSPPFPAGSPPFSLGSPPSAAAAAAAAAATAAAAGGGGAATRWWPAQDCAGAIAALYEAKARDDLAQNLARRPRRMMPEFVRHHFNTVFGSSSFGHDRLKRFTAGVVHHRTHRRHGPRLWAFAFLTGLAEPARPTFSVSSSLRFGDAEGSGTATPAGASSREEGGAGGDEDSWAGDVPGLPSSPAGRGGGGVGGGGLGGGGGAVAGGGAGRPGGTSPAAAAAAAAAAGGAAAAGEGRDAVFFLEVLQALVPIHRINETMQGTLSKLGPCVSLSRCLEVFSAFCSELKDVPGASTFSEDMETVSFPAWGTEDKLVDIDWFLLRMLSMWYIAQFFPSGYIPGEYPSLENSISGLSTTAGWTEISLDPSSPAGIAAAAGAGGGGGGAAAAAGTGRGARRRLSSHRSSRVPSLSQGQGAAGGAGAGAAASSPKGAPPLSRQSSWKAPLSRQSSYNQGAGGRGAPALSRQSSYRGGALSRQPSGGGDPPLAAATAAAAASDRGGALLPRRSGQILSPKAKSHNKELTIEGEAGAGELLPAISVRDTTTPKGAGMKASGGTSWPRPRRSGGAAATAAAAAEEFPSLLQGAAASATGRARASIAQPHQVGVLI